MAKDWKMCILTLVFAASVQQSTPQTSLTTPNTSSVVAHNDSATATGINQMSNTTMPDGDRSAKVNSSTATTHGTQATTTSAGQAGQGTTTPANHQGANQDLNEPVSHSLTVSSGSDAVQSSTAQILLPVPELIAVTEHAEVFIPDIPLVAVSAHAEGPYTLPPTEVFPVLNQPDDSVQESSVLSPPSPFEIVQEMFTDFESQVVALHIELCGNKCLFPYGGHTLKAIGCAKCFCDALCHIYGDCCPDLQLISSLVNESESSTTLSKQSIPTDIDTCEKSHLKTREDENDYDNYFSMVNYCPETDTSDNPSLWNSHTRPSTAVTITPSGNANPPVQTPQTLRDQCENMGNSSQRQYLRPLYSANGVVYRNQYCAQCHGEHSDNLTAWTTSVTCDADLLKTATSAAEAYSMAADTPGCDVRFKSPTLEVLRRCTSTRQRPLVSTCNTTGLWTYYDDKVERACASFTSPVKRRYKNVFCYMCNTGYRPLVVLQDDLSTGFDANIVGRVSFYALLNFDDSDDDDAPLVAMSGGLSESGVTADVASPGDCEEGTVFDPLHCDCRPVQCGSALRVQGNNCTEVFSASNYFGLTVCSRVQVTARQPILDTSLYDTLVHNLLQMSEFVRMQHVASFPRLACDDNTTLTLDLVMKAYSEQPMGLTDMADNVLRSLRSLGDDWSTYQLNVTIPVASCVDFPKWLESIPFNCSTRESTLSMGPRMASSPMTRGFDVTQVSFSMLYNSTFCPHVNLSETEFTNFSRELRQFGASVEDVVYDVSSSDTGTSYFLCAKDFLRIQTSRSCGLETSTETVYVFQDTWTALGVTSVACTCVSLVCLLAVVVTYAVLAPLRAGTGKSMLAMACLLFLAQALYELGVEQFDIPQLCLTLALLIHFFWLCTVFMMTSCTLQLYVSLVHPLKARMAFATKKVLVISLLCCSGLTVVIIGVTALANQLIYGDIGYPAQYICFINRSLSRQLAFGLPLGLAVVCNVVIFLLTIAHVRRRPQVNSTHQDKVSLVACFRLSVITGVCWLSLFLLAVPGTRPWLEYVFVVLLGLQGLLLATTLLFNARVYNMWREYFRQRRRPGGSKAKYVQGMSRSESDKNGTTSSALVSLDTNDSKHGPHTSSQFSSTRTETNIENPQTDSTEF